MLPHVIGFRETGYERIGMLPRFRDLTLRPRFSVIALTALAGLAVPVTASAAVLSGSPTQALVNEARASSQTDGYRDFVLRYQLQQASAATLNVSNHAVASTAQCHDCNADAVAFQVVVASKQDLVTLNASNTADASSADCIRCSSLAGAYQIIYASDQPQLSRYQIQGLNHVRSELTALQFTGLNGAQLQARTDAIAKDAVSVLADGPNPIPVVTPAINDSSRPAELTQDSGPYIDLFIKVKHPGN
jgi:hypothetical protein